MSINGETIYPKNYEHSRIRAYLNGLAYTGTGDENEPINEFLRKGLLQTAFTSAAQEYITPADIVNLNDKIFLFNNDLLLDGFGNMFINYSDEELQTMGYDKETLIEEIRQYRKRKASDYAMANAVWLDPNNNNDGMWWTMIADESNHYENHNGVRNVESNGDINSVNADFNAVGVVPAMIVSDSAISDW